MCKNGQGNEQLVSEWMRCFLFSWSRNVLVNQEKTVWPVSYVLMENERAYWRFCLGCRGEGFSVSFCTADTAEERKLPSVSEEVKQVKRSKWQTAKNILQHNLGNLVFIACKCIKRKSSNPVTLTNTEKYFNEDKSIHSKRFRLQSDVCGKENSWRAFGYIQMKANYDGFRALG